MSVILRDNYFSYLVTSAYFSSWPRIYLALWQSPAANANDISCMYSTVHHVYTRKDKDWVVMRTVKRSIQSRLLGMSKHSCISITVFCAARRFTCMKTVYSMCLTTNSAKQQLSYGNISQLSITQLSMLSSVVIRLCHLCSVSPFLAFSLRTEMNCSKD
jgi:hypothetical protein